MNRPTTSHGVAKPLTVLVTGCAGFIGSATCQLLLEEGHQIVGVDSVNDAYDPRLKEWRLGQLESNQRYEAHRTDITDLQSLENIFKANKVDAVINLAARAGVRQSLETPREYFQTNTLGTLNLLELCKVHNVRKFVLASTSSIYGEGERPFKETAPSDRPLSPYAASKKAAEALCYTYHRLFDIDVTIPRYFTVYGPAGRPDMSIFRFIRLIAEGDPITLFGDGSQERDFTFVTDIARGTAAALKRVGYEIVNLGSGNPVTIKWTIQVLEKYLGKTAVINNEPMHPADVPATWADITKARDLLGWEPETPIAEGLRQCSEWYRAQRHWAQELSL